MPTHDRTFTSKEQPVMRRRGEHRWLSSSNEMLASFRRLADRNVSIDSRAWPGIRLLSIDFSASGSVRVPRTAFFSIVIFSGPPPNIVEYDESGFERRTGTYQTLICGTGQGFDYRWTSPHRASWICLEPELVESIAAKCGIELRTLTRISRRCDTRDSACEHLASILEQEARIEAHAAQPMVVESVSNALACRLVGHFTGGLAPVSSRGALGARLFERIRAYVEQNLDTRISLGDLAEVAGISRFHFSRQFRLRTGESPLGYVLRVRIEHAKVLIRNADTSICNVAARLGFSDQSHFTRTFKRMVGVPPSTYAQSYDKAEIDEPEDPRPALRAGKALTTHREQTRHQRAIGSPVSIRY